MSFRILGLTVSSLVLLTIGYAGASPAAAGRDDRTARLEFPRDAKALMLRVCRNAPTIQGGPGLCQLAFGEP